MGTVPGPAMCQVVPDPPKNTTIVSAPSGEIAEGTRVTLTCMSEADPPVHTYTWIKKSGAVELKSGKENTLTFSKIHSEDSGEYLCRADNTIGHQNSPAVSIKVLYPPNNTTIVSDPSGEIPDGGNVTLTCMSEADCFHVSFSPDPPKNTRVVSDSSGEIIEGNNVTLTCMSEADPPVHTYTWIKKRGAVELESGKENTLTFRNVRSEDSGEYLCRAANRIGQQDSPAMFIKFSSMRHDQTILIAVLVGVVLSAVVGLFCIICRLRQSQQLATNNNKTSGEDSQDGNHGNNMQMNLNPNTTQPDAVYQSLNPNTMQPDPVYQTLNPYSHTN
ncbi:B-cell receptor CD22-like [Alosa alosa]|uniref:B-cell receptor CD22-like n=1 Tax=Alosa alosa TaxID=278164 RepID=UPI00201527F9|nr:B-cell receptor CD22-like [Alosa alosa]